MKKQPPIHPTVVFALLVLCFGTIFFLTCFQNYKEYDLDYDEVACRQLTYISYDVTSRHKGGNTYKFNFAEYSDPLVVDSITSSRLDKTALSRLEQGQTLLVYTLQDDPYEICELRTNSVVLLSLSAYVEANRTNEFLGMILIPILVLFALFPIAAFHWFCNRSPKRR